MTFTYTANPTVIIDFVRHQLGDVTEPALYQDEEIQNVIDAFENKFAVTAYLADGLVTRFAQDPTSVRLDSGLAVTYERLEYWEKLADRYRSYLDEAIDAGKSFVVQPDRIDGYSEATK